jgi:lipoprotein-anchoring transpeptidase ErfK/SrfK
MSPQKRRITVVLAAVAALVVVALIGYFAIHARSGGGGSLAPMATVSPASPTPSSRPAARPATTWLVAKAGGTVVVYRRPSLSAPVRVTLSQLNPHGYPTLMLVRATRRVAGATWYQVWLALRHKGSSGWLQASRVSISATAARIVIQLAARRLNVYREGKLMGHFTVAVGSSAYPTPTGLFYIDEKIKPTLAGSPYGVLALGLSGFQPRLPTRGALAIHGTPDVALLGQAVSDGCIRMRNADVLKVSAWVPSGSPVLIQP